jgi:hypothetical protein
MNKVSNWKNIIVHYEDGTSEESNVNELLAEEKNKFKGWICWAGIQNLTIDNEGNVWRAICKVGGKLGNIYEGFEIPIDPVICTKSSCTCAADIQLSKSKLNSITRLRIKNEGRK